MKRLLTIWFFCFLGLYSKGQQMDSLLSVIDSLILENRYLSAANDSLDFKARLLSAKLSVLAEELEGTSTTSVDTSLQNYFSGMLEIPADSIRNMELYRFVKAWIGVQHKRRVGSASGIDCSQLACRLYRNVYDIEVRGGSKDIYRIANPVKRAELTEGDILFFKIYGNTISHVGIYLQNDKFVHTSLSNGVRISDLNEPYYQKRFFSAGRLPAEQEGSVYE